MDLFIRPQEVTGLQVDISPQVDTHKVAMRLQLNMRLKVNTRPQVVLRTHVGISHQEVILGPKWTSGPQVDTQAIGKYLGPKLTPGPM